MKQNLNDHISVFFVSKNSNRPLMIYLKPTLYIYIYINHKSVFSVSGKNIIKEKKLNGNFHNKNMLTKIFIPVKKIYTCNLFNTCLCHTISVNILLKLQLHKPSFSTILSSFLDWFLSTSLNKSYPFSL